MNAPAKKHLIIISGYISARCTNSLPLRFRLNPITISFQGFIRIPQFIYTCYLEFSNLYITTQSHWHERQVWRQKWLPDTRIFCGDTALLQKINRGRFLKESTPVDNAPRHPGIYRFMFVYASLAMLLDAMRFSSSQI